MILLAIETSGLPGSLALFRDAALVEERTLPQQHQAHARMLVPEILRLLGDQNVAPDAVTQVAVSVGPGSFTGLRVGVTCAKTFAFAAGAELIAVDSFAAVASRSGTAGRVVVVGDAQRSGVFVGIYVPSQTEGGEACWRRTGEIGLVSPATVPPLLSPTDTLIGDAVKRIDAAAVAAVGCQIITGESALPRAGDVGRIALAGGGEAADPLTLEPTYIRKSGAEEKLASGEFASRAK